MSLSQTTNRWIAGHNTQIITAKRDQRCLCAHAGCAMCGIGSSVAASDNDDVKMFHVKHSLLSEAKAREYFIQQMLYIYPAYKGIK
jgi:hypothetical protein